MTVAEMYLASCGLMREKVECDQCGCVTEHDVQQRLATVPNVLFFDVARGIADRVHVDVEEQLDLPSGETLHLGAVVYRPVVMRKVARLVAQAGVFGIMMAYILL